MFADLGKRLAGFARERDLSGIALITAGGETVFEACHGLANRAEGVPIRPATRFGTASVTKMFTAVAVADLIDRGLLEFDRSVTEILPPERRPRELRRGVTVAHLLSHTSAIADYFEEEDGDLDYAALWADRPTYRMRRPADFLPMFAGLPRHGPPGGRIHYSNAGYILLGLIIEELAQAPYTEVVTRRVFERAEMADSGFFELDEAHPDVAVGYLPPSAPGRPWRSNVTAVPIIGGPDGGAYCTAADLDRFIRAYDDGTLLSPELHDTMLTPRGEMDDGIAMGYGVVLYGSGRTRRFGHGGGDPGFEMFVMRFPELDVNGVVMCNVEGLAGDVRNLLVEAIEDTA